MRLIKTFMVTLAALGLLLNSSAFAQQQGTSSTEGIQADIFRASKLIGADVENPQGEDLGKIEDVVIDPQDGSVAYAVLSFGGFLGLGEKYYAIPWNALHPKAGEADEFVLNVDKERLQNAEGFDKNNWPNMADRRWGQEVHAYYGSQPYWERRAELRQDAREHLSSPTAQQSSMGQRHMVNAIVQSIDEQTKRLTLQTTDGATVELTAPEQLAGTLQAGDSVEVVIRKMQGAEEHQGKERTQ